MTTTDPKAQPTADPTSQPPAQPTPPAASPHAETDTAGCTPGPPRLRVRFAAVLMVLGAGSVVIAYLVAWVVVPKELPAPVGRPVSPPH